MSENTFAAVQKVFAEGLKLSPEQVKPESRVTEDLGADSLDAIELIMKLEEEFNVELDPEDADTATTIGDIVKAIDRLKG